jgi:hypothetical protein
MDFTEDNIREYIEEEMEIEAAARCAAENLGSDRAPLNYQDIAEDLACELEGALAELKRRGADVPLDTDTFTKYRTTHPRQDS